MLRRGIALGFWLAFFSGLAAGTRVYAKPADLPANNQIECPDCGDKAPRKFSLELEISPKGVNVQFGFGDTQPESPPILDPFLPAFFEHWLQHAADVFTQPQRSASLENLLKSVPYLRAVKSAPPPETPSAAPPVVKGEARPAVDFEKQIRQLFESADYYRRTGLYESARYLYQRVHLLAPTSRLGNLAIEHLQEIERRLREAGEEQEPDERDVRNGSIPLGLVRVRY
jgi:hypothetical protein